MIIKLGSLCFKPTILQIGTETKIFRAVTDNRYHFQNYDRSKIKEGRFNRDRQYCFYIASHKETAILELISHYQNCIPQIIYVKELILKKEIKLADLIRWRYTDDSRDKIHFKHEHIMVNQHITCPKRYWSNWLYNSTQIIADYFRDNYDGLRYQTSIVHLFSDEGKKIYGYDPRHLFNYAIFKCPNECEELFDTHNDWVEIRTSDYLDYYNKNIDDNTIQKIIKCKNANELVPCLPSLRGNNNCKPSLDIYSFIK